MVVTLPIWTWRTVDMVSGEYMVGVAAYGYDLHNPRYSDGASQLGLVPWARLLDRRCPPDYSMNPKSGARRTFQRFEYSFGT